MTRKFLALFLALSMLVGMGLNSAEVVELPRNETLYFAGQQWSAVNGWNPSAAT